VLENTKLLSFLRNSQLAGNDADQLLGMEKNKGTSSGFGSAFDVTSEIKALKSRRPWPQGMTSKILVKSKDLRIVLTVMEPGARMKEHHTDGRSSIHTVCGFIRVHVQRQCIELPAGCLLAVDRSIKHDVEAVEDSAFLLTIAWPSDQELIDLPHRGYGS
jgi:quercetin dioxygenase-like cupin family protein